MVDNSWRNRLEAALEKSDRSARSVSLAIGRAPGYINTLLREDKQPSLSNLVSLCDELKISVLWLLYGVEMDDESEEMLKIFSNLSEDGRKDFLKLVRSLSALNQ